tara:strand:+ start:21090 stop:21689 length:600 start_codon:yes stop_codon:yes gene_type:complete
MKLIHNYPHFYEALKYVVSDKNPQCVSNSKKKFALQIPLANFYKGFDFYELNLSKDGGVYFTIVTMVGFKTICETNSKSVKTNFSIIEWQKCILDIALTHFNKVEYVVMKRGSIKKKDVEAEKEYRRTIERKLEDERINRLPPEERGKAKVERFLKSSEDFFHQSLEMQQQNDKGCLLTFIFISLIFSSSIFGFLSILT